MKRWYSPRGARRGLTLSALALALWLCWAVGYLSGRAPSSPVGLPQSERTGDASCCASAVRL